MTHGQFESGTPDHLSPHMTGSAWGIQTDGSCEETLPDPNRCCFGDETNLRTWAQVYGCLMLNWGRDERSGAVLYGAGMDSGSR